MKKILLPTDFSENAMNAITYALKLFTHEECTFYILNTYTPIIYQAEYLQLSTAQFGLLDTAKDISLKGLATVKESIDKKFINPKHTIKTISVFNNLIPEMESLIERENIDLVIMGTQGASNIQGVLFGSNTVHVFKNVKAPVLAVPSAFEFESLHQILFPSDYEVNFQEEQIMTLVSLAAKYHANVNVLHVNYGEELSEKQQKNKQKLETYFNHVSHLFHDIKNNNVVDAINDFQKKTNVNLLVMINNKHSFFENLFFQSKINQIGFHLNIPFLVIPSKL